jgi:transcriptional regulator with XRE-family HTH domain
MGDLPPDAQAFLDRPRPLVDPAEFGNRARAARAYTGLSRAAFSKLIGKSDRTLAKIEDGEVGSIGSTQMERAELAERFVKASGCPPEWFDLAPAADDEEDLREAIDGLRVQLADVEDRLAALEGGSSPRSRPSEGQGHHG